jgi:hypothetical protein
VIQTAPVPECPMSASDFVRQLCVAHLPRAHEIPFQTVDSVSNLRTLLFARRTGPRAMSDRVFDKVPIRFKMQVHRLDFCRRRPAWPRERY